MGRGVFRKIIKTPVDAERLEKKDARADAQATSEPKDIASSVENQIATDAAEPSPDADRPKSVVPRDSDKLETLVGRGQSGIPSIEVYGDVEVCRLLKIRRRKIAEARTKATRGIDWDCVGLHAGMTKKWIEETAIKQGIVPDFFNVTLTPIKENDGIVSCKLLGTWPNRTKVTVEVVATGEAKVATVRDANEFHLYDIFDAKDYGREIQWTAELNNATY